MVGHGAVRSQVMGRDARRPATPEEIAKMRALVRQALQEGAVGLSAGLEYEPGRWSETSEVVELAKELPAFSGVYISHERSEGSDPLWYVPSQDGPGPPSLLDAVLETIEIGEKSGARVVASHIKAKGANYWGSSGAAINLIERARQRGADVWADQYPYSTSGTDGSTVLIPSWATRSEGQPQGRGSRADALRATLDGYTGPNRLREAPFWAVEFQPTITFTLGGVKVDAWGRVLDRDGGRVPGLYCAGGDAGGLQGPHYVAGLMLGMVFGPRAVEAVAMDKEESDV